MNDEMPFVSDELVKDFVLLKGDQTVAQAREALAQTGATYGIVTNAAGAPIALTTAGELAVITKVDRSLREVSHSPIFVIDTDVLLDEAVSYSAQSLVENPKMAGLVVEAEEEVVGVLPRQALRKHARRIKTRGGDITQLPGVPHTPARYFVCPQGDYQELVSEYDEDDPPICPNDGSELTKQ